MRVPNTTSIALSAAGAALGLTPALAGQATPCWASDPGTVVASGDNAISSPIALGFAFPRPGGGTTSQVIASTNGFLWLDASAASDDYSPTVTELLAQAPRIAVGWADLECDPADDPLHGVYANVSVANRAVFTWIGNDFDIGGSRNTVFMQATLASDGTITITHRRVDPFGGTDTFSWHDMIVGVSQGNGAIDPGESDLSGGPFSSGSSPTVHERFPNPNVNGSDPRDLDSVPTIRFTPNANGGYDAAPMPCGPFATHVDYGAGCPNAERSGTFYELFGTSRPNDLGSLSGFALTRTPTGYAVTASSAWENGFANQVVWDVPGAFGAGEDSLSNQTLPFTATWGDVTTNAIQIDSNGRLFLTPGNESGFFPRVADFLGEGPSIAPLWDDLSPATAGTVYFDAFPASGNVPARAVITWSGVPPWGNATAVNTFQVQLLANGDILVGYQQVGSTAGLVGFTIGLGADDPGSLDLTAALPFAFTVRVREAMQLDVASGQEPVLNSVLTLESRGLNGASLGVLHVGLTPQSTPLDFLGMPGCTWLASIDASVPLSINGDLGTVALNLAAPASVAGASLFGQSIVVVPLLNPLQLQASNGLELVLGTL